jgi:hypothetical protein
LYEGYQLSYRIAFFFFINAHLNGIAWGRPWNEHHFAVNTANAGWSVRERVDGKGNYLRSHTEELVGYQTLRSQTSKSFYQIEESALDVRTDGPCTLRLSVLEQQRVFVA